MQGRNVKQGFEHSGLFALSGKGDIRCRKDDFGNPILYMMVGKKGVGIFNKI
jgi:protein SCO1/2